MRRMPDDRRLSSLLADPARGPEARRCVLAVGRQVAAFHASLPAVEGYDLVGTMARLWWEGRDQTRPFEGDLLPAEQLDEAYGLAAEYVEGRAGMLRARERAGLVRDGHGDLLTEDIFCLEDGPRVLDCLEFDEGLRLGDVLMDIAFLRTDLLLHGAPDLGRLVIDRYRELTDESHPTSLEHHYTAYRAWVRAKVECLRDRGGDRGGRDRARAALDLCRRELRAGRVHLVLVGGLPGTGKSTLAEHLVEVDDRDWSLLSSDEVRKEQAGVAPTSGQEQAFGRGIYDEAHTARAYTELLRRAGTALDRGLSVVIDASWTSADHRSRASEVARDHGAALTQVRCVAPETLCVERLTDRRSGPHVSDATPEVLRRMAALADPWPEALEVDTAGRVDPAGARVLRALGEQPVVPRTGPMDPRHVPALTPPTG
jgi:predicted kinase